MIGFNYELDFNLNREPHYVSWLVTVCRQEGFAMGEINYIFCDDRYLLALNKQFLQHDSFTDIITFDYTSGKTLSGDIYISVERVRENAVTFKTGFDNELNRVMVHGLLHLMGYGDKTPAEQKIMRIKEDEKINMFHVER